MREGAGWTRQRYTATSATIENSGVKHMATRLIIEGTVQGVGFRYALAAEASALGLDGWVANRRDGTVEACLRGPRREVEALMAWSRHGPPGARVTGVTRSEADDGDIAGSGFHIAPTR
jgi:acylphosphatase